MAIAILHVYSNQAVVLGCQTYPIHNGTFDLAFHNWYDPMEHITALGKQENVEVLIPMIGQIIDGLNPPTTMTAWWKSPVVPSKDNQLALNTP